VSAEYPLHRWTRRLWAWRDYSRAERWWTAALGAASIVVGERAVWEELTASVTT
jgi:acyl-CoA dehydrogenase